MPEQTATLDQAREWQRQFERDRLSMLAYGNAPELPGPGAAAKKNDDRAEAAAASAAEAKKALASLTLIMRTRLLLWATVMGASFAVVTIFLALGALLVLHVHKFMKDGAIKDAAAKIAAGGGVAGSSLAGMAARSAGFYPLLEWLVILVLDLLLAAAVFSLLTIAVTAAWCSENKIACFQEFNSSALDFLGL